MKQLYVVRQVSASLELAFSQIPESFWNEEKEYYHWNYHAKLVSTEMNQECYRSPEFIFTFEITLL